MWLEGLVGLIENTKIPVCRVHPNAPRDRMVTGRHGSGKGIGQICLCDQNVNLGVAVAAAWCL